MKVKEYIEATNYNEFEIVKIDEKSGGLKTIFKINEFTPLEYLNEKILNAEVDMVYVDTEFLKNDDALFTIEIKR